MPDSHAGSSVSPVTSTLGINSEYVMKTLLIWLFVASVACGAEKKYFRAEDVLQSDGYLLISDGSSYYAFKGDGTFLSFAHGISGRTFAGTWIKSQGDPLKLEVRAKMGWDNGFQPGEYRRIVFFVYGGNKRAVEKSEFRANGYKDLFEGYFIIDEMTPIEKPVK